MNTQQYKKVRDHFGCTDKQSFGEEISISTKLVSRQKHEVL